MEDPHTSDSGKDKKARKNRTLTLRIHRDLAVFLLALVVAVAAYFVGVHNGQEKTKKTFAKSPSEQSRQQSDTVSNRWTSVGTVQEASDSNIKVKDSRDEVKDAKITKDTAIVDRKGTKLTAKDIKKDLRVIVSGTKDDKGALTATRIRIQQ